jgi:hypothetical protein
MYKDEKYRTREATVKEVEEDWVKLVLDVYYYSIVNV